MWNSFFALSIGRIRSVDTRLFHFFKCLPGLLLAGLLLSPSPAFSVPLTGDVNQDGHLNVVDATLSLKIATGIAHPSIDQWLADDANGDGRLDVSDAVLILRAIVGLEVLPVAPSAELVCVNTINGLRSTVSLPPLARLISMEPCVSQQAQADAGANRAHSTFGSCREAAQNECLGLPGPPEIMIGNCLNQMWAEGPGDDFSTHGHYLNMANPNYKSVACGFYVKPDGSVWSVQDFK